MDIGIVNPELILPRGAEKQACKLCYFLDKMGHDVTFYTFEKEEEDYVFDPLLTNTKIISLNKKWTFGSYWVVEELRWSYLIKKLSKKLEKHDVINAHNHPAQWISKYTKTPVVWMCNEPYMYYGYDKFILKFIHNSLEKNFSSNIKLILSLDHKMNEIIKKMYPDKQVSTIGSGVDLERKINHIHNDYFDSIFVGPIHPQKRPLDIVKAFALVKEKIKNSRLHFVGHIISHNLKKEMEKIAYKNDITIIFHGSISDENLYGLYDIADIAIFVPELQPWGIFPLETILGHIPTIISNDCGIVDILPEKFPVVNTGNINELASKILDVKRNHNEYVNMTKNFSKMIEADYSWESYAKRMINVFDSILKK